jgi:hypothetical protein
MREKLIEMIQNPQQTDSTSTSSTTTTHVKSADREKSKPYRNLLPVFMIDDDDEDDGGDGESPIGSALDLSSLQVGGVVRGLTKSFLKKNHPHWACSEVHADGSHNEGWIVLSHERLYFLKIRDDGDEEDVGEVGVVRTLSSVIKITSKKKHPNLITFKYGSVVDDEASITHSDRFYLNENPKSFVEAVKKIIDQKF